MLKDKVWDLIAKKLSGEASLGESQELEELLRRNPDLHYPMQTIADLWHHREPQEDDQDAFSRHIIRMKSMGLEFEEPQKLIDHILEVEEKSARRKRRLTGSLLALAALLGLGIYLIRQNPFEGTAPSQAIKSEVSTKYGSRTKLVLPDGTQVWLNSGSKLSYDKAYGNNFREVSLTGEAFFDVVHNPAHPFLIHAEKIDIKVLGTAFNVKSYPGEKNTETSLIRGSLEVTVKDRPSEKYILKPNEKLVIANEEFPRARQPLVAKQDLKKSYQQEPIVALSHLTYAPQDSAVIETSWLDNKLIFRSESFEELAIKMERWYGVTIRFADEEIKKERMTGTFENESIQQALKALQLIATFSYSMNRDEIVISSKPPLNN
jgi:transmembrane sensor